MPPIALNDLIAAGIVGISVVIMVIAFLSSRKPASEPFENSPAYDGMKRSFTAPLKRAKAYCWAWAMVFRGITLVWAILLA